MKKLIIASFMVFFSTNAFQLFKTDKQIENQVPSQHKIVTNNQYKKLNDSQLQKLFNDDHFLLVRQYARQHHMINHSGQQLGKLVAVYAKETKGTQFKLVYEHSQGKQQINVFSVPGEVIHVKNVKPFTQQDL